MGQNLIFVANPSTMLATPPRSLPYFQRAALVVANIDQSLRFYRDVLGFVVEYIGDDTPASYSYSVFRIPRQVATRFATLSSAQQQRTLALIEVPDYQSQKEGLVTSAIVVNVADVASVLAQAQRLGLTHQALHVVMSPPARTEAGLYDADGHLVVVYQLDNARPAVVSDFVPQPLPPTMRQWTLKSRPQGLATIDNFSLDTAPIPVINEGQLLVKTHYLGVAPVMLRYMTNEAPFERHLNLGDVMIGRGVGQVIESKHPHYQVGDFIQAKLGWREYAMVDGNDPYYLIYKMNYPELPISHGISTLAMSGFTALIGTREICELNPSDQMLVSGAAGGVGSQVAFVAKALGVKQVVGIAGGAEKCRILTEELGYDAAIDYKNDNLPAQLDALFPDGIDVFFDNVGGEVLDEVLGRIRKNARIAICGRISEYLKSPEEYHRARNLWRIGKQDAKMQGFFVYDYFHKFPQYERQLAEWIRAGKLHPKEDIMEGIEQMPAALLSLYSGDNVGVRMVQVATKPSTLHQP